MSDGWRGPLPGTAPSRSAPGGPARRAEAETEAEQPASGCAGLRRAATAAAMAGSEPRGAGSPPPASDWGRLEAAILSGWRTFWHSVGKERAARTVSREEAEEETSALTRLPVSQPGAQATTSGCVLAWDASAQSRLDVDSWCAPASQGRPTSHTSDQRDRPQIVSGPNRICGNLF